MKLIEPKPPNPRTIFFAHHLAIILAGVGLFCILDLFVRWLHILGNSWLAVTWWSLMSLSVVFFGFYATSQARRHDEISCDVCKDNLALDAPGEAARRRNKLRAYHQITRTRWLAILAVLVIAGIFIPPFAVATPAMWFFWAAQAHYMRIHRPLTPWCPWCGDDDDGGGSYESVPEPTPPSATKDRV